MDILGLPLHPLVVHAAVVFIPVAALGALLVVFWKAARTRYGWLTAAVAVVAGASAIAARITGESFLASMGGGTPAAQLHHSYGVLTPIPAVVVAIALPVLLWLERRAGTPRAVWLAVAAVVVVAAVAGLVLIGLTGHSGATAVWG